MNTPIPPDPSSSPASIVQAQLEAFNARDIDALLRTYSPQAQLFEFPHKLLASGHPEIRARFLLRFQEPNLRAHLRHRTVLGQRVIDLETVTRTFPEGPGTLHLAAIYEIQDGRIATAWFLSGPPKMD